jgi:hypothetical protein
MKQSFSDDFIIEYQDRVAWIWIYVHQNFSEKFIFEFKIKFFGSSCA